MITHVRNPLIFGILIVTVLYWVSSFFIAPRTLIELMDGFAISFALTVAIVYGKRFITGLAQYTPDVLDLLIAGIAGGWFINGMDRIWRLSARISQSTAMLDNYVIGYLLVLMAFFAGLHLIVRGAATKGTIHKNISSEAWSYILVALIVGSAIGVLSVSLDRGYVFGL